MGKYKVPGCQSEGNLQQLIEQAIVSWKISEPPERFNTKALIFNIWGGTELALINTEHNMQGIQLEENALWKKSYSLLKVSQKLSFPKR